MFIMIGLRKKVFLYNIEEKHGFHNLRFFPDGVPELHIRLDKTYAFVKYSVYAYE